jgi:hypothetical protein
MNTIPVIHPRSRSLRAILLLFLCLIASSGAVRAETPSLKEIYKEHLQIGTAINRSFGTGMGWRRTQEQVAGDIAARENDGPSVARQRPFLG